MKRIEIVYSVLSNRSFIAHETGITVNEAIEMAKRFEEPYDDEKWITELGDDEIDENGDVSVWEDGKEVWSSHGQKQHPLKVHENQLLEIRKVLSMSDLGRKEDLIALDAVLNLIKT